MSASFFLFECDQYRRCGPKRLSRHSHCLHVISIIRSPFSFCFPHFYFRFFPPLHSLLPLFTFYSPARIKTNHIKCSDRHRRTDKQSTHITYKICASFVVTEHEHMGKTLWVRVKQSQNLNELMRNVYFNTVLPLYFGFFSLAAQKAYLCDLITVLFSGGCLQFRWRKHFEDVSISIGSWTRWKHSTMSVTSQ